MLLPKKQKKTLSEKVTDSIINRNDTDTADDDSAEDVCEPKVVDFDEEYELPDAGSSDIRKRNVKLLSEQSTRYKGKIASRKDFEDDESSPEENLADENDEDHEEEEAIVEFKKRVYVDKNLQGGESEQSEEEDYEQSEEDDYEQSEEDDYEQSDDEDVQSGDNESDSDDEIDDALMNDQHNMVTEVNQQTEIQKGVCVQNQLNLWEKLLEIRIHSQKMLNKCNLLPEPQTFRDLQADSNESAEASKVTSGLVKDLLTNLLHLQTALQNQFSEIKDELKQSRKRPSLSNDTNEEPMKKIAHHISNNFSEFRSYRNSVLLKWDDRTKLLTPGAGAKKKSPNEEFDVIRKIDNTLMNRLALIEKTQILKGINESHTEETTENDDQTTDKKLNTNIYDDTDFYHQQLRELIEFKTNSSSNMAEVTQQFVKLQKLRQKMKKKVDTRASKGRKIRYAVHNKLINFMAPMDTSAWTDESKNELYKSLFAT